MARQQPSLSLGVNELLSAIAFQGCLVRQSTTVVSDVTQMLPLGIILRPLALLVGLSDEVAESTEHILAHTYWTHPLKDTVKTLNLPWDPHLPPQRVSEILNQM